MDEGEQQKVSSGCNKAERRRAAPHCVSLGVGQRGIEALGRLGVAAARFPAGEILDGAEAEISGRPLDIKNGAPSFVSTPAPLNAREKAG